MGYVPPRGFFVHSANCLDHNYVVCSERNSSFSNPAVLEIPSAVEDIDIYNKTLAIPTEEELEHTMVKLNRDRCPLVNLLKDYTATCPRSAVDGEFLAHSATTKPREMTDDIKYKINSQNKRILDVTILDHLYGYR